MRNTFLVLLSFLFITGCKKSALEPTSMELADNSFINSSSITLSSSNEALFQKLFISKGNDLPFGCERTPDNGAVICGSTSGFGNDSKYQAFIMKIDAAGKAVWTKTISYPGTYEENLFKIHRTSDGNYIAIGSSLAEDRAAILLVKLDENGNILFTKRYDVQLLFTLSKDVIDVVQTTDGGYAFTCQLQSNSMVTKLSSAGDVLWSKYYAINPVGFNTTNIISLIEDNGTLVAAGSYGGGFLMKIDLLTGMPVFTKGYNNSGFYRFGKTGNNYFFTGFLPSIEYGADKPDLSLFVTNNNGTVLLARALATILDGGIPSMIPTVDGGYLVAEGNDHTGSHFYKLNAQLQLEWGKNYTQPGSYHQTYSITQLSGGGYFSPVIYTDISSGFFSNSNLLAIKTDNNGNARSCINNVNPAMRNISLEELEVPTVVEEGLVPPLLTGSPVINIVAHKRKTLCRAAGEEENDDDECKQEHSANAVYKAISSHKYKKMH